MRSMLKSLAVAVLLTSGLAGCGPTEEPESESSLADTEQSLRACLYNGTQAGSCPSTESCVNGTCRPKCSSSGTCASGQKCCPGYMYSDGSLMYPYCISSTSACYNPGGVAVD
ncbi:MAG TPA: hypothetical protein VE153_21920 [Myxococcus sp.]|jgi:predicted small lipoprotein YifL|nr:hypothetical protein [Myxococcus sp.]